MGEDGKGDNRRFCKFLQEIRDTTRYMKFDGILFWGTRFKVNGTGEFQKKRQAYYNKMVEGMVTELCTRYGPLFRNMV